jgi:hypothetical protein
MFEGKSDALFIFNVDFEEKEKAKKFGMFWNKHERRWCRRYNNVIPLESEYKELVDKHSSLFETFKVVDINQTGLACFDFKDDIIKYCAEYHDGSKNFQSRLARLSTKSRPIDNDDDSDNASDNDFESDNDDETVFRSKRTSPYSIVYT